MKFYVYGIGGNPPQQVHQTVQQAFAEQQRLSRQHPNRQFLVIRCEDAPLLSRSGVRWFLRVQRKSATSITGGVCYPYQEGFGLTYDNGSRYYDEGKPPKSDGVWKEVEMNSWHKIEVYCPEEGEMVTIRHETYINDAPVSSYSDEQLLDLYVQESDLAEKFSDMEFAVAKQRAEQHRQNAEEIAKVIESNEQVHKT